MLTVIYSTLAYLETTTRSHQTKDILYKVHKNYRKILTSLRDWVSTMLSSLAGHVHVHVQKLVVSHGRDLGRPSTRKLGKKEKT
jgi:hypothetical protein